MEEREMQRPFFRLETNNLLLPSQKYHAERRRLSARKNPRPMAEMRGECHYPSSVGI
jgi:hypothetical protein